MMSDGALPGDDLVARIVAGDREAEAALVRQYLRGVRTLLSFQTRAPEEAEDLLQDTFLTVLSKIRNGDLRDPTRLSAFIHGVARNLALAHYRGDHAARIAGDVTLLERIESETPGPLELADRDQASAFLQVAIAELPVERDRALLQRYFFEEAEVDQLCSELGTDRRHFSRVKHRATRRLIEQIKGRASP